MCYILTFLFLFFLCLFYSFIFLIPFNLGNYSYGGDASRLPYIIYSHPQSSPTPQNPQSPPTPPPQPITAFQTHNHHHPPLPSLYYITSFTIIIAGSSFEYRPRGDVHLDMVLILRVPSASPVVEIWLKLHQPTNPVGYITQGSLGLAVGGKNRVKSCGELKCGGVWLGSGG